MLSFRHRVSASYQVSRAKTQRLGSLGSLPDMGYFCTFDPDTSSIGFYLHFLKPSQGRLIICYLSQSSCSQSVSVHEYRGQAGVGGVRLQTSLMLVTHLPEVKGSSQHSKWDAPSVSLYKIAAYSSLLKAAANGLVVKLGLSRREIL